MGFVDGSNHWPPQHTSLSSESSTNSSESSTSMERDEFVSWKMHDRAIMQLITATLSPIAMSCAISSSSSKDLLICLK